MMTTVGKNGNAPQRRAASRILVVDDEDNVRITTAAILEHEGYEVDTASDGHEALDKIKGGDFDLVLTDLRMEGLDGSALLQEICSKHPTVVTVVLTGYASIESSIDALRCGVYDYLVKPCVVDDLKLTVRRALEHKQQRAHISELSSPVVEIWDRILLLPVVGALDDARAAQMSGTMLETARRTGAEVIIIDITGCTVMDTHVAAHLINAVHSARLLGAHAIITGVSAMVAANLVSLGVELEGITTRRRLADGLRTAFEQLNVTVSHGRTATEARASVN
ncbi:MAG TPA: response regulator [Pyrinomonadaceae bacterium]|nr:response regulator [Pyrinomonadaceae bacterium]